jgi:restriction system protein
MREKETRYWGIRLGRGGKFVEHARKGKYIAIGWNDLGNLEWFANKERSWGEVQDQFTKRYRDIYKGTEIQIGQGFGQVVKFVREMKEGDIVVVPDMARGRALMGRVIGPYEYKDDWADGCPYLQRRNVEWIKEAKRDTIPIKLKTSLGSLLTVFSLDHRKQEIMSLVALPPEGEPPVTVTGNELAKVIISRLFNLAPEKFEHFVTHLLTLVGFEATATQYTADRGVDVIGTLNPEGLANITLKAQVKRISGHISNQDILMLRGTLGVDEHGVLITTGGFTKQAQVEAEAEGKKPIALIDGGTLVDLILTHYDELDEEYKELLQLSKREVPLRERFYTLKGR